MTIKAILFDLDGTLVDSMQYYKQAFDENLLTYNKTISFEHGKYGGTPVLEILYEIFDNNPDIPYDELTSNILSRSKELLTTKRIPFMIGAQDFLKENEGKYMFAVCSGSEKDVISSILSKLGYEKYFKELISSNDVPHGKPAPDVWLEAAKRLRVKPEECLVIEDAVSGMIGGKEAGMKVIGIVKEKSDKFPADRLYNSFDEINFNEI